MYNPKKSDFFIAAAMFGAIIYFAAPADPEPPMPRPSPAERQQAQNDAPPAIDIPERPLCDAGSGFARENIPGYGVRVSAKSNCERGLFSWSAYGPNGSFIDSGHAMMHGGIIQFYIPGNVPDGTKIEYSLDPSY